jgi:Glycosyltransferase family 87
VALVAALVATAFFTSFGVLHYGVFTRKLLRDTPVYERYGDAIVHHGRVPYRDFAIEYPPGALPVFVAPSLVAADGDLTRYSLWFELEMLVCGAAASALTGFLLARQRAGAARLAAGTLLAGLAPLALGPVVLSRFDLWPAALTIGALAAFVADRRRLGFGVLGLAVAAKVYAAVVFPLAVAYVWRRAGRRAGLAAVATGAAVVAACFVPFLVVAPDGVWSSLSSQARRPLQIESAGASALLAAHQLWGYAVAGVASHGSDNLAGHLPDALATVQSVLVAVALVAIWVTFVRGPATRDRFLRYSAAAVCAFVALGKVLSPQYLIWLIPLIPLVRGRRGVVAAGLFLATLVLTQLWFPSRYIDLVYRLDPRASWLVFARDVLLVALLAALAWPRRLARAGTALVAALALVAAAAVGAAFASSASREGATHAGLLAETGVASTCAARKPVPPASSGAVRYESRTFVNRRGRAACATVEVRPAAGAQLFSVAYRDALDPGDPRARYLGDSGICSNVAPGLPTRLRYSFVVAGRARFAVEVEPCRTIEVPAYTIEVRLRPLRP